MTPRHVEAMPIGLGRAELDEQSKLQSSDNAKTPDERLLNSTVGVAKKHLICLREVLKCTVACQPWDESFR